MPTYITLMKYTQQGIASIKEVPDRIDAMKESIQAVGGELKAYYLVMGRYDTVLIAEFPDDMTYAQNTLAGVARGNVSTETLKAFTEDEFREIVRNMP